MGTEAERNRENRAYIEGSVMDNQGAIPRPRLVDFAYVMEAKLRDNDYKPGMESMSFEYLVRRLREEADELEEAIAKGNPLDVALEAADVANFAFGIQMKTVWGVAP